MSVELSDEEFDVVYEALKVANEPYTREDVPHLVALEARAWKVLQNAKHRAAPGE